MSELTSVRIQHRCIHVYERCIVQTANNVDKFLSCSIAQKH